VEVKQGVFALNIANVPTQTADYWRIHRGLCRFLQFINEERNSNNRHAAAEKHFQKYWEKVFPGDRSANFEKIVGKLRRLFCLSVLADVACLSACTVASSPCFLDE
jgi:hypothetical protein